MSTRPGSDLRELLLQAAVIAASPVLSVVGAIVLTAPPIKWLPPASDARTLLGILLGAQAAVAALTLAVMIFVLQGVTSRRDSDDRVSNEYIRRSWVHPIFWSSLGMVAITGAVLLAEEFGSAGAPALDMWPGLPNLTLLGAAAFAANLLLSGVLFERALRFVQPDRWRALRRQVNERDVRRAVRAFLWRRTRLEATTEIDESDWTLMFPGPAEGSADEAIRSLLDDARRAMDERRQGDFTRALDSIKKLIEYAMNEIEPQVPHWEDPGAQPEWPPLRELDGNLYSFREEVIRRGNRDQAEALASLDYWLLSRGVHYRCGELFTVGLRSYGANGEIARRNTSDLREYFFGREWINLPFLLSEIPSDEVAPYALHVVRHLERLLSSALHDDRRADFESSKNGFADLLRRVQLDWRVDRWPRTQSTEVYERVVQAYRIALMGLGGRAVLLAESGRLANPRAYPDEIRAEHMDVQQLAADVARALAHHEGEWSVWSDWEMEGAGNLEVRTVRPERYPLTYFTVRLLEIAREPMPALDLSGSAQRVLDWFETNVEELERQVHLEPDTSVEEPREGPVQLGREAILQERRELALGALRAAVLRDEVAADEEVIARELSEERIAAFTADVYAAAFSNNAVERLFARAGAFEYLSSAADSGLEERGASQYVSKGFLATEPENARTRYIGLEGDGWGRGHASGVIARLREALEEAPAIESRLDSGEDLLSAIGGALRSLGSSGGVIVLLTGDWNSITFDLARDPPDGYEPRWGGQRVHARERGVEARYHGHPIIWDRTDGDRRLYVVEASAWGCFVRAQVEGATDLLVEVDAISEERAREMLSENPNHLPDIDDDDVKLRKLQTFVRVGVAARTGFRITNPDRARRVVPPASA